MSPECNIPSSCARYTSFDAMEDLAVALDKDPLMLDSSGSESGQDSPSIPDTVINLPREFFSSLEAVEKELEELGFDLRQMSDLIETEKKRKFWNVDEVNAALTTFESVLTAILEKLEIDIWQTCIPGIIEECRRNFSLEEAAYVQPKRIVSLDSRGSPYSIVYIKLPFSDPNAKNLTDKEALEKMIAFLGEVEGASVRFADANARGSEALLGLSCDCIHRNVEECITELEACLLSLQPPSAPACSTAEPCLLESPDEAVVTNSYPIPRLNFSSLKLGEQNESMPRTNPEVISAIIDFFKTIMPHTKEYISMQGMTSDVLLSMYNCIEMNLIACIKDLEEILTSQSIEISRPFSVSCSAPSSFSCTSSTDQPSPRSIESPGKHFALDSDLLRQALENITAEGFPT